MELNDTITERRRQTRSSIYQYLYNQRGFCSKQTLSAEMGLSLPTVYQNLTELMDAGLVGFSGEQRSTGGRRAQGLGIIPTARIAIGISITANFIQIVAVDLHLQELCEYKYDTDFSDGTNAFCAILARELEMFLDRNHLDRDTLLGVGIAFPGIIDADGKTVTWAPTLNIGRVSLAALYDAIPYPIFIQNDATCCGHAEWFRRSRRPDGSESENLAYLLLAVGVGGCLLLGGDRYDGNHFRSAEFGHTRVERGGLPCRCGRRGCLEAYCSTQRISDDLGITLDEFFRGLADGNPEYAALWDDLLHHLAIGIHNITLALDCDVVLGGILVPYLEPYLPTLRQYVAAEGIFDSSGDCIHLSELKEHSVPLGAALYYVKQFIDEI